MNHDSCCEKTKCGSYAVGILGTLLVMGGMVWLLRHYTETPPVFAERSAERLQYRAEMNAATGPLLVNYDWQDQTRGVVRIPLERAKELVLEEWQNPAAGRSNLMARAAKAFAPLPKPPEKKNEYE
ncbi:MAG TPA: hypothetical protein VHB20_17880 [Verrucomicrobiae bacterium]|jgi:hypothetical protein|nr:hypothetical protein [Verrucomicrobiae bacterium]